jgi:hypothetical protein
MMATNDPTKRPLSASSIEESVDKRVRMNSDGAEETDMPSWARTILAEVTAVRNNTNAIMITVDDMKREIRGVKSDVGDLEARLIALEVKLEKSDKKIADLEKEKEEAKGEIAKLTDDSMRDTLTIHKIPRKIGKETWTDTEKILAQFLADNSNRSMADWLAKIVRAHRGKPTSTVIHCLFADWRDSQEVKELFRSNRGKIGTVYVLEKFSIRTQDRRNLANTKREAERATNPSAKLWIKYPATLMCQLPGEEGYRPIASY